MTDLEPRDAAVVAYLQARSRADVPPDLTRLVMAAVERSPRERVSRFAWAPALAAVAVVLVVVGVGWYGGLAGSGPGPMLPSTPTAVPTPRGTTGATALPSVAGLVAGPADCVSADLGFGLAVPAGWYANDAASEVETPPCQFFATQPFSAPRIGGPPAEARIIVSTRIGPYVPDGTVMERRALTINGLPAERLEVTGADSDTERQVVYLVGIEGELPSPSGTAAWLVVETSSDRPGDEAANVAALDEIAQSVVAR